MPPASTDKNRAVRLAAAIVVMLSASMMTLAQQPGSNYVRVTEHLDASGSQTRSTTTNTYDAIGRKLLSAHPPIMGYSLLDPITVNGGAVTQGAGNEINGGGLHDPGGPGGGIVGPIVPSYQGDTIDYCGNTVVVNGEVNRVAHDKGYITFDEAGDPLFHYYLRDHLGSVRVVFNEEDSTEQVNHYYASGALMDMSTGSAEQPLKYNGKELLREWGMDAYDYGARWMLPVTGPMFMQPDPLCEKYYDTSPYSYCKGNFMNAIDPDGKQIGDYITKDGQFIGTDNKDDGRLYVLKTSAKYFDSYGEAPIAGISKKQERNITKKHDISNADNFVEITGSQAIRNSVVSKIGDDGTGGSADINNREYLIFFDTTNPDEEVMGLRIGPVADPSKANTVGVVTGGSPSLTYIHTHPSGVNGKYSWAQAPSMQDINNATSTSYVIGMRDKIVYIYDGFGIKATLNLDVYKNYIVGRGIRP